MGMGLSAALSIAAGGLHNIDAQIGTVSHNVANAATPGYSLETLPQESMTAGGVGMGVFTGVAQRQINTQMQADLFAQNAVVAGLQTTANALQPIDAALGSPGQNNDLGSLLTGLQNAFSTLANNPSNTVQQAQVVSSAQQLATGINNLASAYGTARQGAQNDIVTSVGTLNTALATIGQLNQKIVAAQAAGQSTADLANQRDAAMQTVSSLVSAKYISQNNGSVLVATTSGLVLPTDGSGLTLSPPTMTMGPSASTGSAILLGGTNVTSQMTGGQIGADITLRDTTIPTYQAGLDEFAKTLASGFNAQGLALFTNNSGTVPTGSPPPAQNGYIGFANQITVNPAVTANPSLVRDGTGVTQNPNNLAGFSGLITNVLSKTFAASPGAGVAGLGPSGTLSLPFAAPATLGAFATDLTSTQSQDAATAQSSLTTEQSLQTTLSTKLQAVNGVNVDSEMAQLVQLQNAYSANARIVAAVQQMFTTLSNIP